jgi:hypothetical protein
MPFCKSCKKEYEHIFQIKNNCYNFDIFDTPALKLCLTCYLHYEKLRELEDRIDTQKFRMKEARKDLRHYNNVLKELQNEYQSLLDKKYASAPQVPRASLRGQPLEWN